MGEASRISSLISANRIGLLASIGLLLLAGHTYFDYSVDDAFISFRYATHVAQGEGLVWNHGEKLESYGNFLWVVILAFLHLLGMDPLVSSKLLGILAGVGLLVAVYALAVRVSGEETSPHVSAAEGVKGGSSVAWLAPVLLAFNRDLIFWMPSGLETVFFAFLVVVAVYRYLGESRIPAAFPFSSLLFLLVALTRPEGGMYYAAMVTFDLVYHRRVRWRAIFLFVIPFCIYHVWRVSYFGDWLPSPYYAKIGGDKRFILGLQHVSAYLLKYLPLFAVLSLLLLFKPKNVDAVFRLFWLMITGIGCVLWMDGDWMWHFRLLIPVTALLIALLVPAVSGLFAHASVADRRARWVVLVAGFLVVHQSTGLAGNDLLRVLTLTRFPMSGSLEGEMTLAMKEVGLWLREHSDPNDLIAVNHAGALPYYADRVTIDMTGLCDRHISRLPGGRHEKYDPDYVLSRAPRYIVLNTSTRPVNGSYGRDYWAGETALYDHPLFQENYRPLPQYWAWRWDAIEPNVTYTMIFERVGPSSG